MSTTTWIPHHTGYNEKRVWVLTNGDLVQEPDLEQTTAGRKVRIKGTDTTAYMSAKDTFIRSHIHQIARQRGAKMWMRQDTHRTHLAGALGFYPDETPGTFHATRNTRSKGTHIWWRFRHETLPIEAVLGVTMKDNSSWSPTTRRADLNTRLVFDKALWRSGALAPMEPDVISVTDPKFRQIYIALPIGPDKTFNTWMEGQADGLLPANLFGHKSSLTEREAAVGLLQRIRIAEELEQIAIPDFRKSFSKQTMEADDLEWLHLKFVDTNCNGQLLSEILAYLDADESIEAIKNAYEALRNELSKVGLILPERSGETLLAACNTASDQALLIQVEGSTGKDGQRDTEHTLSIHLPSGTFHVNCNHQEKEEAALTWQEAQIIARLQSREDEFLHFTREAIAKQVARNTRRVITIRKQHNDA